MTDKTVAKRYAKALFTLGEEQNKATVFAGNLQELKNLLAENPEILHMIENQSIETEAKKNAMKAILADLDETVKNFVCLVLDKERGALLSHMCDVYQDLVKEAQNVVVAKVISAVPLTAEQIAGIETKFSALTKGQVKAQSEVDSALIGGVQVMIGDKLYDGTMLHQIKRLSSVLKQTEM